MLKVSPLAPDSFPDMPAIAGIKMAVASCGIKYQDRTDVLLVEFDDDTAVAGCFTTSQTASSNVHWCQQALAHGNAKILVVNSGNANAFNGRAGEESVERIVQSIAEVWGCQSEEVYTCATGVIGEVLADDLITGQLYQLKDSLSSADWLASAQAIMTTDTYPKGKTVKTSIAGCPVIINGIAKGSGMIAPDMATMLAYIFTDANIEQKVLQRLIQEAVAISFNSITVDSDTSTSDTVLCFATKKAGHRSISDYDDPALDHFKLQLSNVFLDLAHQIVKDGEGASKFITVNVTGAEDDRSAKVIGLSIANSPLVKVAIAGEDANWGRIVMAVGKAGEKANRDKMSISIGGSLIAKNGQLNPAYDESHVAGHMKGREIDISVDVGIADGSYTVWTCDMTHDYITINMDYRT